MDAARDFWLTRMLFQRGLGLVYLIAFLVTINQFRPLLGSRGLLPAADFIRQVPFVDSPSLFYWSHTDATFMMTAWIGVFLSLLAVTGLSDRYSIWLSVGVWGGLYVLYLSFVNVGQIFYGFGWESILLEAGFYAIFLGPSSVAPPKIMIWMLRWLLFRVMFGAGLIKMRGDPCWKNLTCLDYHYETQPMPNRLSWYFHWAPEWTHRAGVAFNHFAELAVPFGYFLSGPVAAVSGLCTLAFQGLITASGNLSWLNLMTMILAIPTFNDRWLGALLRIEPPPLRPPGPAYQIVLWILATAVVVMSINPVRNMLSADQAMNETYNPLHLVGTYGAFGSVTRTRDEIIIEGTKEAVVTPATTWREYEFKGKPGNPGRAPPQIAPYHLRIDWLMWFAAMSTYQDHPWFVHLMAKLLQGDTDTLSLIGKNPFPDHPPRFVRAELYEYHFTSPAERRRTGQWWERHRVADYFPPVSLATPGFRQWLERIGWL